MWLGNENFAEATTLLVRLTNQLEVVEWEA